MNIVRENVNRKKRKERTLNANKSEKTIKRERKIYMLDTTKIEGYADMSLEDKVKALESMELPTQDDTEMVKLKNALNKACAEASDWKKQFRDKQTEQERAEAERLEQDKAMRERLELLENEKAVSGYKASYLALGYDSDLATATAEAIVKGDMSTVFANQKIFNDKREAEFKASLLDAQPKLSMGSAPEQKTLTRADIMAVKDTKKRQQLIAENIELFQ